MGSPSAVVDGLGQGPVCRTGHRPGTVVSWIIYCIRLLGGPATCGVHAKINSLRSAMTFSQRWQAMIEHYDTTPEQTYTWAIWIKIKRHNKTRRQLGFGRLPSRALRSEN
ncbi:hypothetical protein BKP30_14265 [Rhodococcus erythropolis]|nr:hypothetical protein BKP30_14265 [Rhodococcus erythropolis]